MKSVSLFGLLPLFALAACTPEPLKGLDTGDTDSPQVNTDDGGGTDGLDTSTDTAPPLETDVVPVDTDSGGGETADTANGTFLPIAATMYVEFGVNTNGEISNFNDSGFTYPPRFIVQAVDVNGVTCVLEYDLDTTRFNIWLNNGTTPPATFNSWLGTQQLYIGMALSAGLYAPVPPACTFTPARWGADPHATFLAGEWDFGVDNGMPAAVQTIIDANGGLATFYGPGWDPTTALGGYFQVPAGYFGTNPLRNMEAYGFAAEADANLNLTIVQTTAGASYKPVVVANIYDDATGAFQPVMVRLFSMYQINF